MSQPQSIITQVSPETGQVPVMQPTSQEYSDDDSLIHLNIQENHYYITRDHLMSLPESLLLCLFPSGVFMDRMGQVITNLTSDDEVYIGNFPPDCFEYIMETYSAAQEDLVKYTFDETFNKNPNDREHGRFFGFSSSSAPSSSNEADILHEKPSIIVLREDLDYYCVPQPELTFASEEEKDTLLTHLMAEVKIAAGSYLTNQSSIFQGLRSSNRVQKPNRHQEIGKLGPAEQHLLDMLCSSGFYQESTWGNRTQEQGKTVISSLSLCRLANETTQQFRDQVNEARKKFEEAQKSLSAFPSASGDTLSPTMSPISPTPSSSDRKRKSRLSTLAENVRSRSASRQRSTSRQRGDHQPTLYELVPKPQINSKLLLFWRKPARKCWWGEEHVDLELDVYGELKDDGRLHMSSSATVRRIRIPVKLHIRRVWTLELSVVGVQ